jgi:hypothetical protein
LAFAIFFARRLRRRAGFDFGFGRNASTMSAIASSAFSGFSPVPIRHLFDKDRTHLRLSVVKRRIGFKMKHFRTSPCRDPVVHAWSGPVHEGGFEFIGAEVKTPSVKCVWVVLPNEGYSDSCVE